MFDVDALGNVISENILLRKGDPVPGYPELMKGTSAAVTSIAYSNRGEWIGQISVDTPNSQADTIVLVNGIPIAREGEPSVISGRTWDDFRDPRVDINDLGDYVWTAFLDRGPGGNLTSDRPMIMKNGAKFIQADDTFPAISPITINSFRSAPVFIANTGDVFWLAETNNPAANQDTMFLRNFDILVQEGVSRVGGALVSGMNNKGEGFHVSRSGRFWVAEVELQGQGETLLLIDFGAVIPIPGCVGNPATMVKTSGEALIGDTVTLELDGAQGLGVTPMVFFSAGPAIPGSQCGINSKFGEILIGLGAGTLLGKVVEAPYAGSPVSVVLNLPPDPSLVDMKFWTQGVFWDVAGTTGGPAIQLTNGLQFQIGSP